MNFSDWLNKTQMTSFTSFGNQIIYSLILLAMTTVDCILLLRESRTSAIAIGAGLPLAYAIIGGILGARGINAASAHSVRTTSKEYVQAKEKGKVEGAIALAQLTAEHPALHPVQPAVTVNATDQAQVGVTTSPAVVAKPDPEPGEGHGWAAGAPQAGLL